jgi:hypothetical protein
LQKVWGRLSWPEISKKPRSPVDLDDLLVLLLLIAFHVYLTVFPLSSYILYPLIWSLSYISSTTKTLLLCVASSSSPSSSLSSHTKLHLCDTLEQLLMLMFLIVQLGLLHIESNRLNQSVTLTHGARVRGAKYIWLLYH